MLRKTSDVSRTAGTTPPFRGPDGRVLPDSIAEVGHLRLGGLPQWVMIRGKNLTHPVLVLLHGGPGFSETHFFRRFNAPLEEVFTVVYWDQRGSGKSFDLGIPRTSMTVDRFVADLDELVDTVRGRVGVEQVTLFGHSWGSALGTLYAARFPDKVAAFVGSGQIGDWRAGDSSSYAFALAEAQRLGRRRTEKRLRAIGPPPWTAERLWAERVCLNRLEGRLTPATLWDLAGMFRRVPELSLLDLPRLMRGFRFSLEAMWDEVSRLDLTTAAPALAMPVFFFLGRHDHWVPPETSVAYFDALTTPAKQLVWFGKSGHEPFVDEAATFNTAMVELQVPETLWRGSGRAVVVVLLTLPVVAAAVGAHDVTSGLAPYLGGWTWQALYAAALESVLVVNGSLWLLGTAQRRFGTPGPVMAVAERAAFAAYIVQGPVLLGLAVALRPLPVPALMKAVTVGAVGVVASFSLGWLLVSRTRLGRIL